MPQRVRMTRNKPWRHEHPDAVIVDRRTPFGNPFTVEACIEAGYADTVEDARRVCVEAFSNWLKGNRWAAGTGPEWDDRIERLLDRLGELRGKDLACWCPLETPSGERAPCHADVLLELANKDDLGGDR